jgi:hypothetical protein
MPSGLTMLRLLLAMLISYHVWRMIAIAPDWLSGIPQRYPGQYQDRLLGTGGSISLLVAVLINTTAFGRTARGRTAALTLLVVSLGMLAIQVYSDVRPS